MSGAGPSHPAAELEQLYADALENNALVPPTASIIKQPTVGFGHLEAADRPDLMLETLVLDKTKPSHRLFDRKTVRVAHQRMAEYAARHPERTP